MRRIALAVILAAASALAGCQTLDVKQASFTVNLNITLPLEQPK